MIERNNRAQANISAQALRRSAGNRLVWERMHDGPALAGKRGLVAKERQ
jgi:hypothetical protein